MVEDGYAGDVIGVFDPGIFEIGDTISRTARRKCSTSRSRSSRRSTSRGW